MQRVRRGWIFIALALIGRSLSSVSRAFPASSDKMKAPAAPAIFPKLNDFGTARQIYWIRLQAHRRPPHNVPMSPSQCWSDCIDL
jgi:hypothetical protein